jgi:hypothetical protein
MACAPLVEANQNEASGATERCLTRWTTVGRRSRLLGVDAKCLACFASVLLTVRVGNPRFRPIPRETPSAKWTAYCPEAHHGRSKHFLVLQRERPLRAHSSATYMESPSAKRSTGCSVANLARLHLRPTSREVHGGEP